MRYTDIKTKIGITDTAISKNLASLCDEGSIEFERKGREKFYKIGISISKIFERKMDMLTHNYLDYVIEEFPFDHSDYENFYKTIEEKMSAFFIFTIITSIQTGKNWFKAFDADTILYRLMGNFGGEVFADKDTPEEWYTNLETMAPEEYFESVKNMSKSSDVQKNISKLYELLSKKYSEEIKELEKLSKF